MTACSHTCLLLSFGEGTVLCLPCMKIIAACCVRCWEGNPFSPRYDLASLAILRAWRSCDLGARARGQGGRRPPLGLVLGDAAAGAAVGFCLTLAVGALAPLLAHAARPSCKVRAPELQGSMDLAWAGERAPAWVEAPVHASAWAAHKLLWRTRGLSREPARDASPRGTSHVNNAASPFCLAACALSLGCSWIARCSNRRSSWVARCSGARCPPVHNHMMHSGTR